MPERTICDICGIAVSANAHYVVRIDVFADPAMPATTSDELQDMDLDQKFHDLMKQMEGMSADELQDGVHRRFEFTLCPGCQKQFLSNPLGLPRRTRPAKN